MSKWVLTDERSWLPKEEAGREAGSDLSDNNTGFVISDVTEWVPGLRGERRVALKSTAYSVCLGNAALLMQREIALHTHRLLPGTVTSVNGFAEASNSRYAVAFFTC